MPPSAPFGPVDAESYAAFARSASEEPLGPGFTPLVAAASPLLRRAAELRAAAESGRTLDWNTVRQEILEEIRRFEDRASSSSVHADPAIVDSVVNLARYALCAGIDEGAQQTSDGKENWRPLLVELHGDASGGDTFFTILEKIARQPGRHIELLQVYFLCLALGFRGRYLTKLDPNGPRILAQWHEKLSKAIYAGLGEPPQDLTPGWRGIVDQGDPQVVLWPLPWVATALALVALLAFGFNYIRIGRVVSPLTADLEAIGTLAPLYAGVPAPSPAPGLKQLLASESSNDVLIEDDGRRTRITLLAPALFASGSATLDPRYVATIRRLARALNQVPGRVVVEGHTDDQPISSAEFKDNVLLSRARASGVADLVRGELDDPSRLEWTGHGSSAPRYRPASRPEYRARNRRVEIIHERSS